MATARRYKPEDIERGLTALALTGNSIRAAEQTGFNERTIRKWREGHAQRYAEIQAGRAQIIEQACVEEFRQIIYEGAQGTRRAIHKARTALEDLSIDAKDASTTAKNLATAAAIATDKVLLIEGRPTSIVHHQAESVLKQLDAKGFIDSTAEPHESHESHQAALLPERATPNMSEAA